ncbi:hypothetical protein RRF57_007004 [Xylaria bambusicola]|uniref:Uncharacterized protein n=1 Tax=Xylaria bambusicola TaxID=326684 RepID=A0AAN7UFG4_9PEZI
MGSSARIVSLGSLRTEILNSRDAAFLFSRITNVISLVTESRTYRVAPERYHVVGARGGQWAIDDDLTRGPTMDEETNPTGSFTTPTD